MPLDQRDGGGGGEEETPTRPWGETSPSSQKSVPVSPSRGDVCPAPGLPGVRPLTRPLSGRSQPLPPRDARGKILGYTVTAESPRGAMLLCNTSSTACSVLVPPGARALQITAHNSRGASSPASITLGRGAGGQEGRISHAATEALTETGF